VYKKGKNCVDKNGGYSVRKFPPVVIVLDVLICFCCFTPSIALITASFKSIRVYKKGVKAYKKGKEVY